MAEILRLDQSHARENKGTIDQQLCRLTVGRENSPFSIDQRIINCCKRIRGAAGFETDDELDSVLDQLIAHHSKSTDIAHARTAPRSTVAQTVNFDEMRAQRERIVTALEACTQRLTQNDAA